ncbi:TPA: oligosaccharide flippase family protein [Candidatus Woesearchaeota archaeon]|nr:oligosaccharide flippase family protein [Candidatus Woesearchaeota archaeon]HIH12244.1 oligosaccharide flippase family protein [Candidatus Woesearchaeota archaeon]
MTQSVSTGMAYLMASEFSFILSNYLLHILVARSLGPVKYGIYGILMSLYLINRAFLNTGFPRAVSKVIAEYSNFSGVIMKVSLQLQVIIVIFFTAGYFFLARFLATNFLNDPSLSYYIITLGFLIFPLSLMSLYSTGYMGGLRLFKEQAFIKFLFPLLRVIFVLFFIILGFEIFGTLIGTFLASLVSLFICLRIVRGVHIFPVKINKESKYFAKRMISFGIPVSISAIVGASVRNVNVLFVKYFLGENVAVGIYTAAATLSNIPYMVFTVLPLILVPSISKALASQNRLLAQKYLYQSLRYSLLILGPITILLSATASDVMGILYGQTYISGAIALQVLLFSALLLSIIVILGSALAANGKPYFETLSILIVLGIMVLLNFYYIPKYGIYGAALSSLFSTLFGLILVIFLIRYYLQQIFHFLSFLRIGLVCGIIYFLAYYWHYNGFFVFFTYSLLGFLYLLLLYLFGEISSEDITILKKVIRGE